MAISPLGSTEEGPSSRAKLDLTIDEANKVPFVSSAVIPASIQRRGERRPLVSATSLSNSTYVFAEPVTAGNLVRVEGYGINGGGTLVIRRYTRSGDTFTEAGAVSVSVPAGAFSFGLERLRALTFEAGDYVGFYAGAISCVGRTTIADVSLYSAAGNVTSFVDSTTDRTINPQLRITIGAGAISPVAIARDVGGLTVAGRAASAVSTAQTVGTPLDPVAGASFSNTTYVLATPVAKGGALSRVRGHAHAAGILVIRRVTKSGTAGVVSNGDVFTQVGDSLEFSIPATGAFDFDIGNIGRFDVAAGEYLSVYGGNADGTNVVGRTVGAFPATALARSTAGTGELGSLTVSSVESNARLEIALTVEAPTVTEARVADLERQVSVTKTALTEILAEAGGYTPAVAFLTQHGAWYDFTDRRSLSQDAAGTVPVVADGDPIGFIRDKSGNGYNFSVTDNAYRPAWRTNVMDGRAVARFGPTHHLRGLKSGLTRNRAKVTIFALFSYQIGSGNQCAIGHTIEAASTAARMMLGCSGSRPALLARQTDGGSSVSPVSFKAAPQNQTPGAPVIIEGIADFTGGEARIFTNGGNAHPAGVRAFPSSGLMSPDRPEAASWVGGFGPSSNSFSGDVAEIIELVGDVDGATRDAIYGYLSRRADDLALGDLQPYDPTGPLPVVFFNFNKPSIIDLGDDRIAVSGVAWDGSTMVGVYDFSGDEVAVSQAVLFDRLELDDHDVPAMVELPDGHVIAVYCRHGQDINVYLSKTMTPGNLTSWSAPVNIGPSIVTTSPGADIDYSYNFLFRLADEDGRLYLINRIHDWDSNPPDPSDPNDHDGEFWMYATSDDDGTTWEPGSTLWGPNRPYTLAHSNNADRIDFFFNDAHPGLDSTNDVHHCYYKSGNFYKSDDTLIGPVGSVLPLDIATDPTLVFDVVSEGLGNAWVWDLTYEAATGHPVGTFVTYRGVGGGLAQYSDHRLMQARWTGSVWAIHEVCAGGASLISSQPAYPGGIVTDPEDINVVYCSRQVDANGNIDIVNGVYQIFKYMSADDGETWTGTQLTFGEKKSFRPIIAPGARKLFYVTGDYGPTYAHIGTKVALIDI